MTTHYNGSKGPMEIASMPYPYLANAHAKLVREDAKGERLAEIEAMAARLAEIEAEAKADD